MFKNKDEKVSKLERKLYEKEISKLNEKIKKLTKQFEIADKYKNDYKLLKEEYEEKLKKLDESMREVEE